MSTEISVRFGDITKDNIGQLRRLNIALFPVRYNEKFYKDIVSACAATSPLSSTTTIETALPSQENANKISSSVSALVRDSCRSAIECLQLATRGVAAISKLIYHSDIVVGAVCSRIEERKNAKPGDKKRVYIMTLGVLAPYRKLKVGSKLLQLVLDWVELNTELVDECYLHVQTSNTEALAFYQKFGFTIVDTLPNYYKRLTPSDCYVVSRKFTPSSSSSSSSSSTTTESASASSSSTSAATNEASKTS